MKKIIRIVMAIWITIIISTLTGILLYFMFVEIESKPTSEITITCNVEEKEYYNRKVFILTPKNGIRNNKVILYFHGGSYMAEMSEEHWSFIQELIEDSGVTVILPDYPLTPKYTYEDVFNMVVPLYKQIIQKIDTNRLIVMGDSAGGGISLALCEKIGEEQINQPNKLILISPWLDVRLRNSEIEEVEKKDKQLNRKFLELAGIVYARSTDINNYYINPIDGPVKNLKNLIIYTGTNDILNPDVQILNERALKENIKIQINEYKEKEHNWIILNEQREDDIAYQDIIKKIEEN